MRRVLQVMGRSAGGVARHISQVTAALDGTDGLRVDIACPPDLPLTMPKPVIPLEIPHGLNGGHISAIKTLTQLLPVYDVVHAHGLRAGIDTGIAARRTSTRSFVTVHNLVRAEITGAVSSILYRRAEAAAVWANDHTFAVSQDIARHLRAAIPRRADRIEVLYLGVGEAPVVSRSRDEVRSELALRADQPLIVTVARLVPQKSLDVLLQSVKRLEVPAALAVVGEGRLRAQLENEVRNLRLDDRVHFVGFRHDVADWIAAADAFALSSVWEGVPLAVQEAILLQTPVVSTDVGGMRELIANKVSGRLCPPGDPAALASALEEVLSERSKAAGYAEAALAGLRERFSTDRMLHRLSEAYRG